MCVDVVYVALLFKCVVYSLLLRVCVLFDVICVCMTLVCVCVLLNVWV